ncbi:Unconventional myosin-Va [Phytophthora citrophthora]|uniref:Unconventional myosin-Va n=1 Tax=Phytophthora citrophthora TaxID=4793 RepID=A0AAD9LUJ5_9STRA|nr:Unconventional myosin-Va [Phytophthora citrophthora]
MGSDRTKTTGIVKLHVGFEEVLAKKEITGNGKTREKRGVASAELFTIWKKLFYLLDQNNNGCIDRNEFTDVFVNHLDEMTATSDGRKLLQLLFGDESNQENDITPTQQQISTLFALMDTNRDNEIEWTEYLRFLQQRQKHIYTEDENLIVDIPEVISEQKHELRRKNREDRRKPSNIESNQDELPPERTQEALPTAPQEPAAPKRPGKVSSSEGKRLKLHYSNQEQSRLQQQVTALESILVIERRRYAELAADRQALMRSYQQLHLKHQNELLQEQTKAKWMKQTIERQQQQLAEREQLRRDQNEASIVLQSTVRSRLEQKRYQSLKLQRVNAAVTIQCLIRQMKAKKQFQVLKELDRVVKLRTTCASKMQRFIRYHVYRKERAMLVEARELSATILQKNSRRMIAGKAWRAQKMMVLKLQCWIRQRRAVRHLTQRRIAVSTVKSSVLRWFTRSKYVKIVTSSRTIQKWWRRASVERSAYMTRVEASLCIQSAWKRRITRKWFEREWQRQEKYIADLEATICIQAAWRGRRQRSKSVKSRGNTPRYNDDSAIEALLYDLVAMIEAGVVIPSVLDESTMVSNEVVALGEMLQEDPLVLDEQEVLLSGDKHETVLEVMRVMNDLVEAVISADSDEIAGSEGHIELLHDESGGDQSCLDQEVVFKENFNLNDVEKSDSSNVDAVVKTDNSDLAHSESIGSLDEESFSIIRTLLEEMVEKMTTISKVTVLQDISDNEEDGINASGGENIVPQAVNEVEVTGSDEPLVISEGEINNSLEEAPKKEDQSDNAPTRGSQNERDNNSIPVHQGPEGVAIAPTLTDLPTDDEPPSIFDTETVEGDLLIPDAIDSDEANSDNEEAEGSSIDSTDLMMEAEAMAIFQDTPDNDTLSVVASTSRRRKTSRVDSLVLLADVDKLNAQNNIDNRFSEN